ncbi:type III secretion system ATPase SctN [Glaciimonas immobilis]|uniref:Type III secretion protein N (ATPase) n=1 Tax=Glaciimonas immobilis TaxID=728004 RepID=A0A840RM28_9BURK|nr:type III secretion system ATPase SctN [Glaciimonas immobilis]KAF3999331.1 FliI/YscN family ATPase [Glaciimonas immobilis]MBB5198813.1 type III secretion protein N (ATPase) [Glaciimonas immobilis]
MTPLRLLNQYVHPHHLSGTIIEARLRAVSVGEVCEVRRHWREVKVSARAQVIGFRGDMAILSLMGNAEGLSRESVLVPTGGALTVRLNDGVLGTVLNSNGVCVARLVEQMPSIRPDQWRPLDAPPPSFGQRTSIQEKFQSGIKVIDALTTCGIGQRLGIFAPAGAGKTSLVHMLIEQASADVFVIGLIGERGREVTEFVESLKHSPHLNRCVVVYATSDASSIDRRNAALLATTVAEYYRDHGSQVVLVQDSLTRYARALRDVALAAGEPPARRGYPASVFESLPRLLERPGVTTNGSITAFYTILLESEDEADPIAEEIRSILDGHIYLSRKLAAKNHYPAVDVLRSLSRVASQVCDPAQLNNAALIREKLSRIEEMQLMLDMGEYRSGENADNDRLLAQKDRLFDWLRQNRDEPSDIKATVEAMHALAE